MPSETVIVLFVYITALFSYQKTVVVSNNPRVRAPDRVSRDEVIVRNWLSNMKVPKLAPPLPYPGPRDSIQPLGPVFVPTTQEVP